MRTRLKPTLKTGSGWISFEDFRKLPFVFYVASTFTAFLGLYTSQFISSISNLSPNLFNSFVFEVLTFISVSASSIGINSSLSFYVVSIANATSAIGRMGGGVLALKHGPVNILIIFTSIAFICTYIWPFMTTTASFLVVTCIYGYVTA